jgi:hypothetical protein
LREAGFVGIDLMSLDILFSTITTKARAASFDWFLFLEALKYVANLLTTGTTQMNALGLLLDSVEAYYPH